jgi:hypothetical protein
MSEDTTKPIPIRLTEDLLAQIDEGARLSGKSKQEVMRVALDYGLTFLKRSDYKVADAVIDTVLQKAAESLQMKSSERDIALLSDHDFCPVWGAASRPASRFSGGRPRCRRGRNW